MSNSKVLVKLYGESFKIHRVNIKKYLYDINVFYDIARQLEEPLELALLNIHFFKLLNDQYDTPGLHSMQDFVDKTFGGLINNSKARIEIRNGRKILQKFSLDELFNPKTLLPLFNVEKRILSLKLNNNLFLIEKEVGLIDAYELEIEYFDIYKLKFNICDVHYNNENYQLLLELSYNEKKLQSKNSDSLITHQHCVSHII